MQAALQPHVDAAVSKTVNLPSSVTADETAAPLACRARPDDLAVIVSTGGSTGVPKGSVRSFAAYAAMVTLSAPDPARRQLANGPLAHLTQVLVDMTLLGRGNVVLQEFDAAATLAAIESARITDLFLVEPQLWALIDHADVAVRDLSSLRTLTHIGASAPATLRRRARTRLGAVLAHTYGGSEFGLVSMLSPAEHDRPDRFATAGRIRPGIEVRFRRTDGTLAEAGHAGTIEVRAPALAAGYRNQPVEQAAAFVDVWYRTGDIGRLDDGYLHVLGRAADLAAADGIAVTPTAVEDTLCRLAAVRYAVVVRDRNAGTWVAAVVPLPGATVDPRACRVAVATEHGAAAASALVVEAVDELPLTEQGKPDRTAILELHAPNGRVSARVGADAETQRTRGCRRTRTRPAKLARLPRGRRAQGRSMRHQNTGRCRCRCNCSPPPAGSGRRSRRRRRGRSLSSSPGPRRGCRDGGATRRL